MILIMDGPKISIEGWLKIFICISSIIVIGYILITLTYSITEQIKKSPSLDIINLLFLALALFSVFLSSLFFVFSVIQSEKFYISIFDYLKSQGESLTNVRVLLESMNVGISKAIEELDKSERKIASTETSSDEAKQMARKEIKNSIQSLEFTRKGIENMMSSPAAKFLQNSGPLIPKNLYALYGFGSENKNEKNEKSE